MLESRGAEARLTIVDEHIAHEVAHRLEPLVATFGDEPEWHDTPGGNVMLGHAARIQTDIVVGIRPKMSRCDPAALAGYDTG